MKGGLILAAVSLALAAIPGAGAEVWFTGGGIQSWNSGSNWSSGKLPGSTDVAVLGGADADLTLDLDGSPTVAGLRVTNAWTTLLQAGGASNQILTIGAGGIVVAADAGALNIGLDETNQRVSVRLSAGQEWVNDSQQRLIKAAGGGAVQLGAHPLTIGGSGEVEFLSAIEGAGMLVKRGAGNLILRRGNPSVAGGFVLHEGRVVVGNKSALTAGPLLIHGGRLASLDDALVLSNPVTLAGDTGLDGRASLGWSGAVTLASDSLVTVDGCQEILNPTSADQPHVPIIFSWTGTVSDGGSGFGISKTGGGTLVLGGANRYLGPTQVLGGLLQIDGDQSAATGEVTVAPAGILGGAGRIGGPVVVHGVLEPGRRAAGTLALAGPLQLRQEAVLRFTVTAAGAPRLLVAGTLDVAGEAFLEVDGSAYDGDSTSLLLLEAGGPVTGLDGLLGQFNFAPHYAAGLRPEGGRLWLDIRRAAAAVQGIATPPARAIHARTAGDLLWMSFPGRSGYRYKWQHSADLSGWSGIGEPASGTDPRLRIAVDDPAGSGLAAFFRITETAVPRVIKTDLFREGWNDIVSYRIPGIVVAASGTVLVTCEARVFSGADRGEIEIHMRRSTDGGHSWGPPVQIAHIGPRLPRNPYFPLMGEPDEQTVNNPMLIADAAGPIHFIYCVEYQFVFYCRSDDDGLTWTPPRDLTPVLDGYRPGFDWQGLASGPGHGIQLANGRLLVPFWLVDFRSTGGRRVATLYSDDAGTTWLRGDLITDLGNEANLAQLSDGRVILTARNGTSRKAITTSPGGISGWTPVRHTPDILEPGCMAGLVAHPGTTAIPGPFLVLSNPHTTLRQNKYRRDLALKVSRDDGLTWPVHKVLEHGPSAYSDLAVLPDGTLLCFYESGHPEVVVEGRDWPYAVLRLARIPLEWLQNNTGPLPWSGG